MTTPGKNDPDQQGIDGPGGVVLDQYVLLEMLSNSRRGAVYKAKHRLMGRMAAIKFLSAEAAASKQFTERFHRATKILALLEHPNLVRAHEAAQQGDTNYLVMEYIDGQDLHDVLSANGAMPVGQAVSYILQTAAGLAYAHDQGVFHRNIKPRNLVLDRQGVVKIVGFGLAHVEADGAVGQGDDAESLTTQGQVVGSYEYMAPEQAADSKSVDERADIYSLGCTLYTLLTGRPPYTGKGPMLQIVAHSSKPVPSLRAANPEVPEALDRVFAKMMAKKPEDRFASMKEVIRELEPFLPAPTLTKRDSPAPAQKPEPAEAKPKKNLLVPVVGGSLLALVVVLVIAFAIPEGKPVEVAKKTEPKPAKTPAGTPPAREKPEPKPDLNPKPSIDAALASTSPKPRQPRRDMPLIDPDTGALTVTGTDRTGVPEKPKPVTPTAPKPEPTPPSPPPPSVPEKAPKVTPEPAPKPEPSPPSPKPDGLPSVPSKDAIARASQLMRDTFQDDLAAATTPAAKLALAKRLIGVATDIRDDPAGQFVILDTARDLAIDAGDGATGLVAIDAMASGFAIDAWTEKVDWLAKLAESAKNAEQRRGAATQTFELAKVADDAAKFEIADRLCKLAISEGKKAAPFPLIKEMRLLSAEIETRLLAFKEYETASQKLAADSTNREANLTAGRYECFVVGNWVSGLQKLTAGSDASLQALATKDLAAPSDPERQVDVADGWQALAEGATGRAAANLHEHAADWYEKAVSKATGLLKAKAERRLEESRAAASAGRSADR